jgi:predicted DNA-binding antitoxin AbrB/MazE fold protein
MTITVRAIFENGVFRPLEPLALEEGQRVAVTIVTSEPDEPAMKAASPKEQNYAMRLRHARSLEELFAVMADAPRLPEHYDLCAALNANREAAGERLLFPESNDGTRP